jgi:hypothetical protein
MSGERDEGVDHTNKTVFAVRGGRGGVVVGVD